MREPRARDVTRASLKKMPLPRPDAAGDKDARGRVLVVGGSAETPGAILLAGVAALRAGAGKLQLATARSVSAALGIAVPESLVVSLPETRGGEITGASAARVLAERVEAVDAVLLGPGMGSQRAAHTMVRALVQRMGTDAVLVLDAAAIVGLANDAGVLTRLGHCVVLTPHAGEMASLMDVSKDDVEREPVTIVMRAARRFGAVVVLKGAESWIATPDGDLYRYAGGSVGLATSGSGDTLAGIVAGLAARGAPAVRAAVWGAYLHGAAGRRLTRRIGPIGFLARELLDEVPTAMHAMGS